MLNRWNYDLVRHPFRANPQSPASVRGGMAGFVSGFRRSSILEACSPPGRTGFGRHCHRCRRAGLDKARRLALAFRGLDGIGLSDGVAHFSTHAVAHVLRHSHADCAVLPDSRPGSVVPKAGPEQANVLDAEADSPGCSELLSPVLN